MNFSSIDHRKQIQRKKKRLYQYNAKLSFTTYKKEICLYKQLLFQLFNPHLEGTFT